MPLPSEVKVGAMVEVPALLWQLPELLKRVDFLSVGSNDLQQFLFAADRDNPRRGRPLRHAGAGHEAGPGARWRARQAKRASRSACAARWRAIRWRQWRCCASAIARLSMAPPRVLPMRAADPKPGFQGLIWLLADRPTPRRTVFAGALCWIMRWITRYPFSTLRGLGPGYIYSRETCSVRRHEGKSGNPERISQRSRADTWS